MIRASATTPRRPLSPSKKLLLLERQGHICPLCETEMRPGDALVDEHMRSLGLSGSNDLDNRAMVHVACAEKKTRGPDGDHAKIVKAKAQKRAAFGFDRPKRPMQGGRNSPLKRLIGGGVVIRATGEPA
ncbi:hypothetical protein [Methylobacterium aquaticum]|uniref:hypothetical protein n=1 Tax=Methylobacterium aquaticum TaxID=270351 RepID=UPI0019336A47|nr:hypothetical protein [Methylobacterium aquaticum]QRE76498.1 hypothetical protein F1D61_25615 [Methylobacterium aquaticum]